MTVMIDKNNIGNRADMNTNNGASLQTVPLTSNNWRRTSNLHHFSPVPKHNTHVALFSRKPNVKDIKTSLLLEKESND